MKSSLCTVSAVIVNEQLPMGAMFGMVLHVYLTMDLCNCQTEISLQCAKRMLTIRNINYTNHFSPYCSIAEANFLP